MTETTSREQYQQLVSEAELLPEMHRQPGFRLSTFEVFNWGTFYGKVHSFNPRGATALIVGENGAGKSTLVDAMLTLLVRPGVRNYNVAAGATKKERDERTYIRGAYDRTAGRDEKPQIQYLRDGSGFYTALLATFASSTSGTQFTLCQVMYELGPLKHQLDEDIAELESLRRRKGNLPDAFIDVRKALCDAFKLSPTDLPFAAELIAVDPSHARWEATIEQVLHSFARTLLVPADMYAKVSGYVDARRLTDSRGRGMRLTYDRVANVSGAPSVMAGELSLPDMLLYRDDHSLAAYVRGEIRHRFDHLACESIGDFQMSSRRAMTIHRHVKRNHRHHAKDDSNHEGDRRNFVLGWDNRFKREALEHSIHKQQSALEACKSAIVSLRQSSDRATSLLTVLEELSKMTDFEAIDDHRHEFEASQLRLEKEKLEASNDRVKELKSKLADVQAEIAGLDIDRDSYFDERSRTQKQLDDGKNTFDSVSATLSVARDDGTLVIAQPYFKGISEQLNGRTLAIDNMGRLPTQVTNEFASRVSELEKGIEPIRNSLTTAMGRLLSKFPVFESELDPTPQSLSSFESLHDRILQDDLPRHERRFRQRLKEKVLQEIGLLHGSLEDEREEIRSKVEMLNEALRRLDWRPGTYMRLEPSDTSDIEIRDFRRDLAGCLSEGSRRNFFPKHVSDPCDWI